MKVKNIKPRKNYILVKPSSEYVNKPKSNLVRPDREQEEPKGIGEVISVGPEIKDVKAGQTVLYAVFGGDVVNFKDDPNNVDYILLHDDDVLSIVNVK